VLHPKPIIAVGGDPTWADTAEMLLRQASFSPVRFSDPAHLAGRLIDNFPALLLVDGDDPHWSSWIKATRTDQATRRLPIVVIARAAAMRQEALAAGAKGFVRTDGLGARLVQSIREHGRFPDPALLDELACQCEDELPPLAQLGVQKFNAGEYYAQHDAFEHQWMAEAGPVRDLYRAILQVGIAYHHITRGNALGGVKMLRRSVQWFSVLPDVCQGVNVRQLREEADHVYMILQTLDPADIASFDLALLKPIRLVGG
jgi:predicted metal-dependent hydrolase